MPVKSILDNNLDRRPTRKRAPDATPILHSNIRGPRALGVKQEFEKALAQDGKPTK